jgi:tetratricopeptide (TPR) repeat protein
MGVSWCVFLFCGVLGAQLGAQSDPIENAVDAFQRGDLASAEQILRAELRVHPANADADGMLGLVLDRKGDHAGAAVFYKRALAAEPQSPSLWNNYGNNLMASGKLPEARAAFAKVLVLKPTHPNAAMQLARICLVEKKPEEALRYLDRLPADAQQTDVGTLVRMQALYELHKDADADAILARIGSGSDAAVGEALATAGQYGKAEEYLGRVAAASADEFEAQYRWGLAASHAGDNEHALIALTAAHRIDPKNAAAAYDLAIVEDRLGKSSDALELLAQTAESGPGNADVLSLLARVAAGMGYFDDAIAVWDRYLKLRSHDETALRDRAFAATALGQNMEGSLAELRKFARAHPDDAIGHFELGTAEAAGGHSDEAERELDRALQLNSALTAAHLARGLLAYRAGNASKALPDFKDAAQEQPQNATALDRLGEALIALDRADEALIPLRKAAELEPRNSRVLLHLGRALAKAGQNDEAAAAMARLRELGPDRSGSTPPRGLVSFLSLPAEERERLYRAGVERTVRANPANAEAQVRYLELLSNSDDLAAMQATARKILNLKPGAALLTDAADALIRAGKYDIAKSFITEAITIAGPSSALQFDLTQAAQAHHF